MEDIFGGKGSTSETSPEVGIQLEEKKPHFMQDFFARVTALKEQMTGIRTSLDRFEKLKASIANSPDAESTALNVL